MHRTVVAVVVLAVLTAGCQDTPNGSGTSSPTFTETTGEPSPEPTTPETTGTEVDKPSIEIANAPVGGDVRSDGLEQCADVNWLGREPIPDGTTITVGKAYLDPSGVFRFHQDACPGGARTCAGVTWEGGNPEPCYVGVRQVAHGSEDVVLVVEIAATCETDKDCQSLAKGFGKSQIKFEPEPLETPTTEPPSNGTPTSETPSNG